MARAPSSPGKTRLSSHLPSARLTALRSALLADTLHAVERLPDVVVFFTPDDAEDEMASMAGPGRRCVAQGEGDLGARMLAAIRHLLAVDGYDGAVLIGSDIPLIGHEHLADAIAALEAGAEIVLGPADDGGYYLIGMRRPRPALFDGIAWGTGSVLTSTLRAAERLAIAVRLVRGAYDIDTIDDLHRLEADLRSAPQGACPAMRRWLREPYANG